jgi:glucan phosphoethanolaminetransferase (alkaline phosphatase superfamily)
MARITKIKLFPNIVIALVFTLGLIAPDFIAQIFNSSDQANLSGKFIAGIFFFSIFLSFVPRFFALAVLLFFMLLELVQFGHLFYYKSLITAQRYALLFEEFEDILIASKEAIKYLYIAPMVVLLPYLTMFLVLFKLDKVKIKSNICILFVSLMLTILPTRVYEKYNGVNFYPDPADHSLRNSLYAFCNFVLNKIEPQELLQNNYLEYQVKDNFLAQEKLNIILIIGESVNPRYMSLFGYEKDTTPLLNNLKNDKNFIFGKAISAAVNTTVSVPLLLNGIYEPNNFNALETRPINLFKLAKKHAFKNFYISSQSGSLLTNVDAEYIDTSIYRQKSPILFELKEDEALLEIGKELDYGNKNFIVLHKRNIHAPYEDNYKHNQKFNKLTLNKANHQEMLLSSYENALRFEDEVIESILEYYINKFDTPTYIFFTPDHGEGLGVDNTYGHSDLKPEIYNILFMAYLKNDKFAIRNKIEKFKLPLCHYEIHNIIAYLLGFDINNPNYNKDICYVQGSNLYGNNSFVKVQK